MRVRRTLAAALSLLAIILAATTFVAPNPVAARPPGFVISAPDGNLYLVYDGVRHGVDSPTLAALGIAERSATPVSQATLELLRDGQRLPSLRDGALLAGPDGARYLLAGGLLPIPDDATWDAYGWAGYREFPATAPLVVDAGFLAALPRRAPLAPLTRDGPNRFDWGYCTWWIAQRRAVTWLGNAIDWYDAAQEQGYAVGDTPAPGAILVRRSAYAGGYGHVAYVESVAGTSFTVSEMNVAEVGVLSTRTYDLVTDPPPGLVGFIYWRYADPAPAPAPAHTGADTAPIVP